MTNNIKQLTKEITTHDEMSYDLLELINAVFTFQPQADLPCLQYPDDTLIDFLDLAKQGLLDELLENLAEYSGSLPKDYRWSSEFLGTYHPDDLPESTQVRMYLEHHHTGEPFGLCDDIEDIEIPA